MKYDLKGGYDFDAALLDTPEKVMRDICDGFEEITQKIVCANIRRYDGKIESYDTLGTMAVLASSLQAITQVDIQDQLGAIGNVDFKYELYLSAEQIENYKYRILFAGHGISSYPVKVVVEQEIADELNDKEESGYIYTIKSKSGLERLLIKIFNSKTIQKVVQDLIIASKRKLLAQQSEVE